MTKNSPCRYGDDRDRALVDYLYGECDPGARTAFELHLVECGLCAGEVSAFRGVRQVLAGWAPPEPMRALDHSRATADPVATGPRLATVTRSADRADVATPREVPRGFAAWPVWAQAAAAVLCVGVGLGSANLRISYSEAGLSVGTGWLAPAAPAASVSSPASPGAAPVTATADARPWQADLAALADELRADMRTNAGHVTAAAPVAAADDAAREAALIRQVRALIQRSEERQQQEMAVRVSTMLTDLQNQRRSDLARIERTIGVVQNNTGMEVLRQQQLINSLAVRVSSQR